MEDRVEAAGILPDGNGTDIHYRFIGKAENRTFVVNVLFAAENEKTREKLNPVELDFVIAKIFGLLIDRIVTGPNRGLC